MKMKVMKRILFSLLFGGLTAFAVWQLTPWFIQHFSPPKPVENPVYQAATLIQPAKELTQFTLTDTQKQLFTQQNLMGFWTVLFFGYAQCPDICPTTLAKMGELWRLLESPSSFPPRFIFVSLDPETDSIENLQKFLSNFHPSFIGLTGHRDEMQKLAKAVRVYSWTDPSSPGGKKRIDHTAALMLINPQGRLQALFTPPHDINILAKEFRLLMK